MASVSQVHDSLVISDPERSRSTCNIFVAHVDDAERERLGRLFVVTEIAPAHPDNQRLIHTLQETVSSAYYSISDRGIETSFEQALAETNARLQDFLRGDHRPWLQGFSTFIGILKDTNFVFTHVGAIQAFLIRGNRIVDLLHSTGTEAALNPLKIFSSVVTGQLEPGDSLLVATTSLLDYFSQEKLRRTITSSSPAEAAAYFDQLLRDNPANTAFAAFILQLQSAALPAVRSVAAPTDSALSGSASMPGASMDKLIERERSTRELLTPSLWRSLQVLFRSGARRAEDSLRTRVLHKPARRRVSGWREQEERPQSLLITGLLSLWRLFVRLLKFLLMLLVAGLSSLRRLVFKPAPSNVQPARDRMATTVRSIQRLTRRQQLVLGGVAVLLLLLSQGLIMAARPNTPRVGKQERSDIVRSVNDTVDRISAMLTYGDEQGARKLIGEADDLITKLPAKRKGDRQEVESLKAKLVVPKEKTQHIVRPSFEMQADLTALDLSPVQIALVGNFLLVAGQTGKVADVTSAGKPADFGAPEQSVTVVDALSDDRTLLLRTSNGLLRFTPSTKVFEATTITLPEKPGAWAIFQQRLYAVDATGGQILRYTRAGKGYATGTPWLKDQTVALSDVTGLAVDGSVFVLQKDGTLLELVQGSKRAFTLDPVDPPLAETARLWTDANSQRLYILATASKRLLSFDKNGKLEAQFIDDRFGNALGFAINEKTQTGYVLTRTAVESFSLAAK